MTAIRIQDGGNSALSFPVTFMTLRETQRIPQMCLKASRLMCTLPGSWQTTNPLLIKKSRLLRSVAGGFSVLGEGVGRLSIFIYVCLCVLIYIMYACLCVSPCVHLLMA